MQLSEHFSLAELCKSATGLRLGIANVPGQAVIANLRQLCVNVLEPIRAHYARPVRIFSGYRSPELNRAVHGAANSQHMAGEAADIEVAGVSNPELARWILGNMPFDQVILEFYQRGIADSGWVHVSYRPSGRKEALTAERISGRTVYRKGLIA